MPRKPNRKKHTHPELTALRDTFLRQLHAKHTPDADRVLDIYKSMRSTENGEARTTLSQQLEVLGCQRWLQLIRCHNTGATIKGPIKVCRRRFLCLNCHKWKLQSQVERWYLAFLNICRTQDMWLGPLVQLKWNLPQLDPRASLESFDRFIENTLSLWFAEDGVAPGQWMICRTFDPIQCAARLVYAGPAITRDLWLRILYKTPPSGSISNKSLVISPTTPERGRGQLSPWRGTATDFGEAYLLNPDPPPASEFDVFARTLRECLFWCVGNVEDLLRLQREQVWRIYVKYNHTRMFSGRGLLYEGVNAARIERMLHPQKHLPSLLVDKQHRDGEIESVLRDPIRLLGGEYPELPDDSAPELCPHCGEPLSNRKHEIDAEPTAECKNEAGDEDDSPPGKKKTQ